MASSLLIKQKEVEARREAAIEMKKQRQEELKQRNIEMAAKAGHKAEELM